MSTVPLALPSLNTTIIPPESPDDLIGSSAATLTPGMSGSDGETPLPLSQQILNIPGNLEKGLSLNRIFSANGWFGLRGVTMILGFLLIAAGLFAHSGIREKIIEGGKAAAAAAA